MSKVTVGILLAAITLIIVGTYLDISHLGGGPGAVLVGGLCYSYFVAKRQVALFSLALNESREERLKVSAKPTPVPQGLPETKAYRI